MAVVIIHHSETAGHVPPSLVAGQVAINSADGVLFWLDPDGITIRSYSFANPVAPTKGSTDNSTAVATTAFVQAACAALVAGAPASLDTFNEIATALGGDPAFSSTVNAALANRVRVDTLQPLTGGQQTQAQTNIGLDPTFPGNTSTALANRLRIDTAQGLTSAQQIQARQNAYAAPFDAMAYSGMQVNGACEVAQDGAGPFTANASYPADNWQFAYTGTMIATVASQAADVPAGFGNALKITITTAEAALGAGDFLALSFPIEGYRFKRCAFGSASASPVSIAFWVKAHRPGTYSGSLRNGSNLVSCPFTFTINSADTWEYKTVTQPGCSTNTWTVTNAAASNLAFTMASGATYLGPPGAWAAANYLGATGQVNGVAANTDYFAITGLIVLPGIELPTAAQSPLIQRTYDQELQTCLRYYWRDASPTWLYSEGISLGISANSNLFSIPFRPIMRAVPTVTLPTFTFVNLNTPVINSATPAACTIQAISNSAANTRMFFAYSSGSFIANARL